MSNQRYFLVQSINGAYETREIEAELAQGMHQFGLTHGQYTTPDQQVWHYFYVQFFLPCCPDDLAKKLTQRVIHSYESPTYLI